VASGTSQLLAAARMPSRRLTSPSI
jgi:hypothetical protein